MPKKTQKQLVIYKGKSGAIEFRDDFDKETIWGTQKQIAEVFGVDRSVIAKHIRNIFKNKEVNKKSTCAFFAQVRKEGNRTVKRNIEVYNLDIILAVGHRTNSSKAIEFRKWATKTLKQHILEGYTINKKRIGQNYEKFMQAMADVKTLLPAGNRVSTEDVLELINAFAGTWFSLDVYDTDTFPKSGSSKKRFVLPLVNYPKLCRN